MMTISEPLRCCSSKLCGWYEIAAAGDIWSAAKAMNVCGTALEGEPGTVTLILDPVLSKVMWPASWIILRGAEMSYAWICELENPLIFRCARAGAAARSQSESAV